MTSSVLRVLAFAVLVLTGCTNRDSHKTEVVVFAAASLTDAFEEIRKDFEKQHENFRLRMSYAGSQSLRTQIQNGAAPQIFASANAQHMQSLVDQGLVDTSAVFATNQLVIAVPKGNPAGINELSDLPKAERLVLAESSVPAGAYAEQMLESVSDDFAKRVLGRVVSRETHVRQTLQKVVLGEADAAIVYATDAKAAGDKVEVIAIPAAHNVIATYPIGTIAGSAHQRRAKKFVDFVLSSEGSAHLQAFGFRAAP